MREIKFRGQCEDNGEWAVGFWCADSEGQNYIFSVYGIDKSCDCCDSCDCPEDSITTGVMHKVVPRTVGQFTGRKDKKRTEEFPNGKEICEGDVVIIGCYNLRAVIKYEHCSFSMFHASGSKRREYCSDGQSELIFLNCEISTEIIGNIHENPELLEIYEERP